MEMTEKRFTIHGDVVSDTDMKIPITLWSDKKQQKKFCDELNALHEENERLLNQLSHIQYRFFEYKNKRKIITEKEVKKTLQKYFNRYTQMALELRHDKYGNGVCHDVTEILMEIADDLGVKLE